MAGIASRLFLPLACVLTLLGAQACGEQTAQPTYRVELQPFVHQVSAEGNLTAVRSTQIVVPSQLRDGLRLAWRAPDGMRVQTGDVIARFDAFDLEQQLRSSQLNYDTMAQGLLVTQSESGTALHALEKDVEMANLQLSMSERFQKQDEQLYSRVEILESEINQELAREVRERTQEQYRIREDLSDAELDLLQLNQQGAEHLVDQAKEHLQALEVKAPHDGLLTWRRDWRGEIPEVGERFWPGRQLAEIPDLSEMQAEVYVLEADAGGLTEARTADLIVESRPDYVFPARIENVSAVAQPRFRGSPLQYFSVTLRLEQPPEGEAKVFFKPGQRVLARLHLAREDEALVVPRQALVREEGEIRVYVRGDHGFEPRRVELGVRSAGLVTITEGLQAGDEVALGSLVDSPHDVEATTSGSEESPG